MLFGRVFLTALLLVSLFVPCLGQAEDAVAPMTLSEYIERFSALSEEGAKLRKDGVRATDANPGLRDQARTLEDVRREFKALLNTPVKNPRGKNKSSVTSWQSIGTFANMSFLYAPAITTGLAVGAGLALVVYNEFTQDTYYPEFFELIQDLTFHAGGAASITALVTTIAGRIWVQYAKKDSWIRNDKNRFNLFKYAALLVNAAVVDYTFLERLSDISSGRADLTVADIIATATVLVIPTSAVAGITSRKLLESAENGAKIAVNDYLRAAAKYVDIIAREANLSKESTAWAKQTTKELALSEECRKNLVKVRVAFEDAEEAELEAQKEQARAGR